MMVMKSCVVYMFQPTIFILETSFWSIPRMSSDQISPFVKALVCNLLLTICYVFPIFYFCMVENKRRKNPRKTIIFFDSGVWLENLV